MEEDLEEFALESRLHRLRDGGTVGPSPSLALCGAKKERDERAVLPRYSARC
jgi:hypothetical protein